MPGVLIVEALAQTGAVLVMHDPANAGKLPFFARIDNCRFRQQVRPGDTLRLEVEVTSFRGPVGKAHARALVGGTLACEADLTFALGNSAIARGVRLLRPGSRLAALSPSRGRAAGRRSRGGCCCCGPTTSATCCSRRPPWRCCATACPSAHLTYLVGPWSPKPRAVVRRRQPAHAALSGLHPPREREPGRAVRAARARGRRGCGASATTWRWCCDPTTGGARCWRWSAGIPVRVGGADTRNARRC